MEVATSSTKPSLFRPHGEPVHAVNVGRTSKRLGLRVPDPAVRCRTHTTASDRASDSQSPHGGPDFGIGYSDGFGSYQPRAGVGPSGAQLVNCPLLGNAHAGYGEGLGFQSGISVKPARYVLWTRTRGHKILMLADLVMFGRGEALKPGLKLGLPLLERSSSTKCREASLLSIILRKGNFGIVRIQSCTDTSNFAISFLPTVQEDYRLGACHAALA